MALQREIVRKRWTDREDREFGVTSDVEECSVTVSVVEITAAEEDALFAIDPRIEIELVDGPIGRRPGN